MSINVRSRYWGLPPVETAGPDGPVASLPVRRPPRPPGTSPVRHVMIGFETLEYLAWRFYSRSAAWWHIADANPPRFPLDYRPGNALNVPEATGVGQVFRTRTF